MTPIELDPRSTFDTFVVGQGNRLATAAARRVAEAPGRAYNPLFLYSGSGLGKTHLLTGIGHLARKLHPSFSIVYDSLERFLDQAMESIQTGEREAFRARVQEIDLLLLDDVQFLAGRHSAQEELLRSWDAVSAHGGQVVLASDRPPNEINGLDDRLLSRFSGGLIADIAAPDYETRVAIVIRKIAERAQHVAPGVAEALARVAFANVRELQGGLNKLLAIQDLDGRQISPQEIPVMFGVSAHRTSDEFAGFFNDIADAVSEVVAQTLADTKLAEAIRRWQSERYSTRRLEAALLHPPTEDQVDAYIAEFERDISRLREIEAEVRAIEPDAPELVRGDLFRSPDKVTDAEQLLEQVRERNRPLPAPPPGRSFETLKIPEEVLAVKAARAIAEKPGERYNPFYVHGPEGSGKTTLLAALANELGVRDLKSVAFVHGHNFSAELIVAIERNCVDSWRRRYRSATVFVLDDIEALAGTERAQEELFHLFEELKRSGAQIIFGGEVPPRELTDLDERLRTRLESGLVVSILERPSAAAAPATPRPSADDPLSTEGESDIDDWFLSREKIVWSWPYLEDWLVEDHNP